ncbi:Scr1 family TA system antitoxin-like transcriptional regulator [Nocardiopsis mwathae]|uniref:Scr1 family TA system antitoxin-like transcriptional regulator n=1 Tax=Nocardiopsis mwathae TaxID=1472723 RepID=UPI0037432984
MGFETQAIRLASLDLGHVPGLLQTPDYARAIMLGGGIPPGPAENSRGHAYRTSSHPH